MRESPSVELMEKLEDNIDRINVINQLREYKIKNYRKYNFSKIGLFGSVARNSARESSDIDIIIELNSPNLFLLGTIKCELEEKFGRRVDIIRLRKGMNAFLKSRIDKEAIYV